MMETGDILLVYNKRSWLHKAICYFTGAIHKQLKAGHVLMYLFDGMVIETNFLGTWIKKKREFDAKNYSVWKGTYDRGLTWEEQKKISVVSISETGSKYAFTQLFALMYKYIFRVRKLPDISKKAVICSEQIARIYSLAGLKLFDKEDWEVTPDDFFSSGKLRIEQIV